MKGEFPIQDLVAPPPIGPPSDIGYEHEEGVVAEFECREAARFALLSWPEFEKLSWRERANTVAHFRLHNLIERFQIAAQHNSR